MMSAADISETKVAVEICNNSYIRQQLLERLHDNEKDFLWVKTLPEYEDGILESLPLAKELKWKIRDLVNTITTRMLKWAAYHAFILSISREECLSFIRNSFFTSGKIDNAKAAEVLLKEENLSVERKFKLACFYSLSEIPAWYNKLQREGSVLTSHDKTCRNIRPTKLHKIWTSAMNMNATEKRNFLNHNVLQESLKSGSKEAVAYCLESNMYSQNVSLADIGLETIKCIVESENISFDNDESLWVPNENYVDILYLILNKMNIDEKIDFLKKDISRIKVDEDDIGSRVLWFLLNWPYQNYFLMIANLMWDFLPESDYAVLLMKMLDIAEKSIFVRFNYEKTAFDYRKLFTEFWLQSPEHYKRFIFTNQEVLYDAKNIKAGESLFIKIFEFQDNYTLADEKIISMILASSTDDEKKSIVSPEGWNFCLDLVTYEKWRILDEILPSCFISHEKIKQFKQFFFSSNIDSINFECILLIEDRKEYAVEFLLKWADLSDDEMRQLKRQMIYSNIGKKTYLNLLLSNRIDAASRFVGWFHLSEEEVKGFKRDILFRPEWLDECEILIYCKLLNRMYVIINYCLTSDEEFKKYFFDTRGCLILENLISRPSQCIEIGSRKTFNRGNWEEVEQLVTWYFASEEEISNFKKEWLISSGAKIHFQLIMSCQFERAETFFAWMCLADEEVKMLKKDTFYIHEEAVEMMVNLLYGEQIANSDFGNREEKIALLLRWYLTDVESVIEFQNLKYVFFKDAIDDETRSRNTEIMQELDLMAEQLLEDLNFVC